PLVVREFRGHRRERDRVEEPVAGAYADRAEGRRLRRVRAAEGPEVGSWRGRRAEQGLEEAARPGLRRAAILRAAVVHCQRAQDGPALLAAVGTAALQPLQLADGRVEAGPDALDLVAQLDALRRLPAAEQEEARALAPQPARLRYRAVELELLFVDGIFIPVHLLAARRVADAAVERGELALEPHAGLAPGCLSRGRREALGVRRERAGEGTDQRGREYCDRFVHSPARRPPKSTRKARSPAIMPDSRASRHTIMGGEVRWGGVARIRRGKGGQSVDRPASPPRHLVPQIPEDAGDDDRRAGEHEAVERLAVERPADQRDQRDAQEVE